MTQQAFPDSPAQPALRGLSSSDTIARAAAGLSNQDTSSIRTDGDVVRGNLVTFFNVVLGSLIAALLAVGEVKDGLFVGVVVLANVAVSTLQELKATRTLRELRALTAPKATVIRDGESRKSSPRTSSRATSSTCAKAIRWSPMATSSTAAPKSMNRC